MTNPALSAEIAELADLALVHSVLVEVLDAAAVLQQHPLDDTATTRMQRALGEQLPPAKRALDRLQAQRPLPGSVTRGPAGLRSVELSGEGGEYRDVAPRPGAPFPHRGSGPGCSGGAS